jgi:small-conductance mechanosensitive channel
MEMLWHISFLLFIILLSALVIMMTLRSILSVQTIEFVRNFPNRLRKVSGHKLGNPIKAVAATLVLMALLRLTVGFIPPVLISSLSLCLKIFLVGAIAWLIIGISDLLETLILNRFDLSSQDNLRARKVQTKIIIFRKVSLITIGILAFSFILMSFKEFRQVGAGLLASMGVAGIIVGLAAQRTVGALLAGIQLAITQPVRIDDVLVVEGEWGRVEEINFTYVVVRIWDSRRLVLPTTYFLEKPFQNWTRVSSDLLGTVFLYVDYSAPIEALRARLKELLENSPYWDRRVWALQVTSCSEHTMELRALMSASDSSRTWELRCEIREKMLEFLRLTYPGSLPKVRLEKETQQSG